MSKWSIAPDANEITQIYGCVNNPFEWTGVCPLPKRFHSGIDLGAVAGGTTIFRKPVYATRSGTIARIGYPNGLGSQAIFLMADDGRCVIYGHIDSTVVTTGRKVKDGELLGYIGTKGNSTAPHLHVEVRTDGPAQSPFHTIDPTPYLNGGSELDANQAAELHNTATEVTSGVGLRGLFKQVMDKLTEVEAAVKAIETTGGKPSPFNADITPK
jgi:murein DD-endopeptidase MepM/ murein hydrolase activator NlpD